MQHTLSKDLEQKYSALQDEITKGRQKYFMKVRIKAVWLRYV